MGKMSREKGKRGERWLANYLKERGYDARRTAQFCGRTGDAADVVGLRGIHIEAKWCEKVQIRLWYEQAKRDAEAAQKGEIPVVVHKVSRQEPLVTMSLDDFMKLYERGYGDGTRKTDAEQRMECNIPESAE